MDPVDLFTLFTRVFAFLALTGMTIAYAIRGDVVPSILFGLIALWMQFRSMMLIRKMRAARAEKAAEDEGASASNEARP